MKEFLEFIEQNEEAKAKVNELDKNPNATYQDFIDLAKGYGFDIAESDFVTVEGELSEEELGSVTGGDKCVCPFAGGGTGDGKEVHPDGTCSIVEYTCACVLGGGGEFKNTDGSRDCRCACIIAGSGSDVIWIEE